MGMKLLLANDFKIYELRHQRETLFLGTNGPRNI